MTERAGGSRSLIHKVAAHPELYLYRIEQIAGTDIEVWGVNGKLIRDKIYIDYTQGGNFMAYSWFPQKLRQIWIDVYTTAPGEVRDVKIHELSELNNMLDGISYDPVRGQSAHVMANVVEQRCRDFPDEFDTHWQRQVDRYVAHAKKRGWIPQDPSQPISAADSSASRFSS